MIHFITHITTDSEIIQLSYIRNALEEVFPESRLHVFNQTGKLIAGGGPREQAAAVENIKSCGFGWTLRFLEHGKSVVQPGDLLIKIDPDISIRGNPMDGITIPESACFGQVKLVRGTPVFLGGFQGFGYGAIERLLVNGPEHTNDKGPQDLILYQIGAGLGMKFISLPWVDSWAEKDNYDPNYKILAWRKPR